MAEAGAHLTTTSGHEQPSIFEVLAQESLTEAVKPALRHAVKVTPRPVPPLQWSSVSSNLSPAQVLAESNPSVFGVLWRRFDEVYLLLDLLLQNHFLSHSAASFSENFYGLKRVCTGPGRPAGLALGRRSRWRSLLLLCVAPYLRAKLEALLARQREEEDFSIRVARSRTQKAFRALAAAYPYVSTAWQVLLFSQQLLFIFGKSRSHSPLLWLARVRLERLTALDFRELELKGGRSREPAAAGSLAQRAARLMSQAARGVAVSLSTSLSLGVFFLQFLDWWYSAENQSTVKTLSALPVPPPPLSLAPPPGGDPAQDRTCPLCRKPRTNATALSTSGFVFCYPCIYAHVKAQRSCPLSGFPSELQHLIKIYTPDTP
ncbi:peroxisome assembly protein 12 isoform 1-T1 [Synchiropus picturatus]